MSIKIGEELPGRDEQGAENAWKGENENGLNKGNNGGHGHGMEAKGQPCQGALSFIN